MNKIIKFIGSALMVASIHAFALDLNTVFNNQAKAAFPDTCEFQVKTTVMLPNQQSQTVEMSVINAGSGRSQTTIRSGLVQMKATQNGNRMKIVDLKTGKVLPSQNIPPQNPVDISKQFGSPADYKNPAKEGSLWKIVPKDASKPVLYYSANQKRIVKMHSSIQGGSADTYFEYCDNSCKLPGTLKKIDVNTILSDGKTSKVTMDILNAERRKVLPPKMFDIE